MKLSFAFLLATFFAAQVAVTSAQQIKFNRITRNNLQTGPFFGFAQDKEGFLWTVAFQSTTVQAVLYRYDGVGFKIYKPDTANINSITNKASTCLFIDKNDLIWIGHLGGGLDSFDPESGKFTHYRYKKGDVNGLSNDTVYAVAQDIEGNLWVGTGHGLNVMNTGTGKFKHYFKTGNPGSISSNRINVLYTDHEGNLWIGCGGFKNPPVLDKSGDGGLNLFNKKSGRFTRYLHDPLNPKSITNNKISCIYEDSNGTFWVGTQENGLHTLDRNTGVFTYYPYDPAHPDKLSSPPLGKIFVNDAITFFQEDINKNLWIGTSTAGLYLYNRATKKMSHFGDFFRDSKEIYKDTTGGFTHYGFPKAFVTKDGLLWLSAYRPATIYNLNFNKLTLPFVSLNANGNAFYQEPNGSILWVGTNKGLIRKDLINKTEKIWSSTSPNNSGWAHDTIGNMVRDKNGTFWIATLGGGLCKYDPATNKAFYYMHNNKEPNSIASNMARNLLIDQNNNIWVGTWGQGLDMLDSKSQKFIHYVHTKDSTSLSNNTADYIFQDKDKTIWVGGFGGLDRLNKDGKTFHHYLNNIPTVHIFRDQEGVMWVGSANGLYYYDKEHDHFLLFIDPITQEQVPAVIDILEDNQGNLWARSYAEFIKINKKRTAIKTYGEARGIIPNTVWISRCLKGKNGELFFGTLGGYNEFFPEQVKDVAPPNVNITKFELNNAGLNDKKGQPINAINLNTNRIELNHDQNTFSIDFVALHYNSPGEEKYRVKLENYDHLWHDLGVEHQTSFFDVLPGIYKLKIRAFNADGAMGEKDLIIVIHPPWWKTWWAYILFAIIIIGSIWGIIVYRGRKLIAENKILEEKVTQRTKELERSLEDLKSTQKQLIQSEKMASLGELTAGIAHEIQNPLNFVNNFCEVNTELIDEMRQEINNGNLEDAKAIADDIKENQQKINHHGKRADAIVKGMLQHSRKSTGQKEPTDINALADEYLRLSYHGLRAKDKSFNAAMKTDLDPNLEKIDLVAQDIGRVLVNLFNNSFYAVSEKKKLMGEDYEPTVHVSTKKLGDKNIEIKIRDNGNGIPQQVMDKLFQPFFTTKPTGEGTGLGLSISYDIINKGHNGTIKAETTEGEFAEFTIVLPG